MMWEQLGSNDCLSRTMPPIMAMYTCIYVYSIYSIFFVHAVAECELHYKDRKQLQKEMFSCPEGRFFLLKYHRGLAAAAAGR